MDNNKQKIPTGLFIFNIILVVFCILLVFLIYGLLNKKEIIKAEPKVVTSAVFENVSLIAKSAYVFDVSSNKVLFSKNEMAQLPLASLTKLMTALTAMEILPKNSHITIRKEFLAEEGDSGLLDGETWKLKNLLDFSLMVSSNDGARSVASVVGATINKNDDYNLGRKEFVNQMNLEAKKIGLVQTYFLNETGLDESTSQSGGYSSAVDVSKLLQYMITTHPEILEMTKNEKASISSLSKPHLAQNTNEDIPQIPGLLASKTGYTALAGGNLAVVFDSSIGRPIIVVVLGSTQEGRFEDVMKLVNASMSYVAQGE